MNQEQSSNSVETGADNSDENSGMKAAAINQNPKISLEEARNAAEGKANNAAGGPASSTAEEHVPSTSDPNASDLPSAR